jgi:hypothetical protein
VQSKHTSPTPGGGLGDAYRTVSETGEVLFYDTYGRILPIDGGGGLARFNVEREVTSHG